jgi:cell division protease FtsH
VNIGDVAAKTPGSAGAELKNIMNEAAISAARDDRVSISKADLDYAIEKVNVGLPRKITYTIEERKRVAVHEIGHALVSILLEDADSVDKVSILPIGEAGGITTFVPEETNLGLYTYDYLINKIQVALGGHACEELIFGTKYISTGASEDFRQVTSIATSLVHDLGYSSKIGKLAIDRDSISDQMKYDVEKEVYHLVKKCYSNVYNILVNHEHFIDEICDILIEKETISGKELREYLFNHIYSQSE